jgi:hypothetical protein
LLRASRVSTPKEDIVTGTLETLQFVAIVLTALSMGVHFGTWLTEAPLRETRSGELFTEVQQGRDRVAARIMPILGNAAILSVAACAFLLRAVPGAFAFSLVALVFIVGDMAVTLAGNVPINKQVQSWNLAKPPSDWAELRDRWERLHTIRTALIVSGFASLVAAVVFFRVS